MSDDAGKIAAIKDADKVLAAAGLPTFSEVVKTLSRLNQAAESAAMRDDAAVSIKLGKAMGGADLRLLCVPIEVFND